MELVINNSLYRQASDYAKQKGLSLDSVIEGFLLQFISRNKKSIEQPVPDVVMSLLGAGEPVSDDDINGREAYHKHLEEKYK